MAQNWHDAPEVAPHQSLPEVYYPAAAVPIAQYRRENLPSPPPKPFHSSNDAATFIQSPSDSYPGTSTIRNYDIESILRDVPPPEQSKDTSKRLWVSSNLVSILTAIIAFLFIAVIGLAAGTGVLNNKVKDAELKLALPPNDTIIDIDRGCSANPESVTASRYTSQFFGRLTYTVFCDSDAPNPPLQTLFVGNFDDCIDACASYSVYTAGNFPTIRSSGNFTCSGVSFIPDWTNRTTAMEVSAPGNCYLKPGPQNSTALTHSGGALKVHAAILQRS
ncbi:hypothetical protein F5Y14DRAFT_57849 [Nemania sp. NC0429]|nr:hypothetical protein F5Y14DRAFT_57849 [Nemania sp. NC0429]